MTCKDGRFNTGNKLCSNDLRDTNDNAIVLDGYINSSEKEIEDRFGTPRLTLAGIEKKVDDRADDAIGRFEGEIDAIIKEAGGVEVTNEWGDSPDKVLSQGFLSEVLTRQEITIQVGVGFNTLVQAINILRACPNPTLYAYTILIMGDINYNGVTVSDLPSFNHPIIIKGNEGLKVWSAPVGSVAYAFRDDRNTSNPNTYAFENIEFNGWHNGTTNSGGIVAWFNKTVIADKCRFINCGIGLWVSRTGEGLVTDCYFSECEMGAMVQYHSNLNVGQAGKPCIFENNRRGIMTGRNGTCHNDYSSFLNNDYHIYCAQNGRLAHAGLVNYGAWNVACILNQTGQVVENLSTTNIDINAVTQTKPILLNQHGAITTVSPDGRSTQLNTFKRTGGFDLMPEGVRTLSPTTFLSIDPAHTLLRSGNIIRFTLSTTGGSGSSYLLELSGGGGSQTSVIFSTQVPAGSALVEFTLSFNDVEANYFCRVNPVTSTPILVQGRLTPTRLNDFLSILTGNRLAGRCYITATGQVSIVNQFTEVTM